MEPQDLGPTAAMQIRSVPERVREYYNEMAYAEGKITLGELFTRIALGVTVVETTVDGRSVSAVQSAVAAAQLADKLPLLLQAAQAYELVQRASGQPMPKRSASALNAAIAGEVKRIRGFVPLDRLPLLESDTQA